MELVGGKKGLKEKMSVKFSSGESEPKMQVLSQDKILVQDIPSRYIVKKDDLRLVTIGKILQSLEGCACPMGVLSREFLAKLKLDKDEVAIIDMEAGIEHFGRGIETSVDSILVVVEPSFESLELAAKVKALASSSGTSRFWAVINKINSSEIAAKIKEQLNQRGVDVIGVIHYDPEVFEACFDGRMIAEGKASVEIRSIINTILINT